MELWYRLTLLLGHSSVAACMASVSSGEFTHWQALDAMSPLPDRRNDYYFAQLTQLVANRWRTRASPYELSDFLLFQNKPERTHHDVEEGLRMVFGAMTTRKQ